MGTKGKLRQHLLVQALDDDPFRELDRLQAQTTCDDGELLPLLNDFVFRAGSTGQQGPHGLKYGN
jgi:hypothetical protein